MHEQTWPKRQEHFDKKLEQNEFIILSGVIKMLREHDLIGTISQDEIIAIIKTVNLRILKNKQDLPHLDYKGFITFLLNFANYALKELKFKPLSFQLQRLISAIRKSEIERGMSICNFDDPEGTSTIVQPDVINEFNKKLKENPDFDLGQGLRKVEEKTLE